MMTKLKILINLALLIGLILAFSLNVRATANYVYHEKTENFVNGSSGTKYFVTSGSHGTTPWSTDTVTISFKVEYQFGTNQVRLYYTTDGSTPSGSFGTGSGTTTVLTCSYNGTFGSPVVDIVTCPTIPAQTKGTTVKYIVSAWDSGGGDEYFANSGSCGGCGSSGSGAATVFSYTTLGPNAVSLASFAAHQTAGSLALAAVALIGLSGWAVSAVWRRR